MIHKTLAVCLVAAALFWAGHAPAFASGMDGVASAAGDLTLWYQQPATNTKPVNDALPIGNAHLGALIGGGPDRERLTINEDSLWTGGENPSGNYDTMGAYQVLGNVSVHLPGHTNALNYRRDLNLADAVAGVKYTVGNVNFQRQYFCSHPAGVLVGQLTSDHKHAYTGSIELSDTHNATLTVQGHRITAAGTLDNGMKFEWQLLALNQGGTLSAVSDTNSTRLEFQDCDGLTLMIGAGTDYIFDYAKNYHGADPHGRVTAQMDAAAGKSVDQLRAEHVRDYQSLFGRVQLDLGSASAAQTALPTDQRKLAAFAAVDPGFDALQFQYGRYLLISCSRPGGLPANLQGLWNDNNRPPWHCDYHVNINIQMNYWPAEVTGLSECHTPLIDLIVSQLPAWRKATAAAPEFRTAGGSLATRGFAIRTSHNITGGMGWKWDNTANAWYCQHLWDHYAFTMNRDYLRTVAYPVMKETCEFWEDHLKTLPDGRLVVPNAWSPEHGPVEDGVSYSQEIVWDLFNHYVQAADALGVDQDYRAKIAGLRDHLATPGIGSWGQLLEWMHEQHNPKYPELDTPNDHHRHTSHLFAVYPGTQISVTKTPKLAAAAKVLLDARGVDPNSEVREWSFAWRTALYAHLRDPESAYDMLRHFFAARNSTINLFGLHPPVQMDGDFGVTAAIAEMLLESQMDEIDLLPALPQEWPTASVSGLRARGGYEISLAWKAGKLTSATIKNITGTGPCQVRYGDKLVTLKIAPGSEQTLNGDLQ